MTNIQGSTLTKMLSNLCKCDFVTTYAQYGKTVKNVIYRLADFYTLFYFKYVENDLSKDENRWLRLPCRLAECEVIEILPLQGKCAINKVRRQTNDTFLYLKQLTFF